MKVCFIIDNLRTAGAQVHLSRLARGLFHAGLDVSVISLGRIDADICDFLPSDRITHVDMASVKEACFWPNWLTLIGRIHRTKPDIVHTYLNTSNVFGGFAARLAGVRTLISSRRDMGHFRSNLMGSMERMMHPIVSRIVCASEAVKNATINVEKAPQSKVYVLYTGIDTNFFSRSNSFSSFKRKLRIGSIATMDRTIKGHQLFVNAAFQALDKRDDLTFVMTGDGALRPGLEKTVHDRGLDDYFVFTGHTPDVRGILEQLDLFVLPSVSEGFSNALLEAMSMELPVVAFAVDGNLEIVEQGRTGFLCPLNDTAEMANRILDIVSDNKLRMEMGHSAREAITRTFTVKHMITRYIEFYSQVLAY